MKVVEQLLAVLITVTGRHVPAITNREVMSWRQVMQGHGHSILETHGADWPPEVGIRIRTLSPNRRYEV